jgi:hypothetical protein
VKICGRCKQQKDHASFTRDRSRPDGLFPWCRTCNAEHQKRLRATRERTEPTCTEKRCSGCRQVKASDGFHRYARSKDGLAAYCRTCKSERAKTNWGLSASFARYLVRKYGITPGQYNEMLVRQEGRCAICRETPRHRLCVDHDHETGQVRALLCKVCNLAIGYLKDDPDLFRRAADYLETFGQYNLRR